MSYFPIQGFVISSSDQIRDGIILGSKLVLNNFDWWHYDEFWYAAPGDIPYESEGTIFPDTGGPGVLNVITGSIVGNRSRINTDVFAKGIDPTKTQLMKVRETMLEITNGDHFVGFYSALPTAASPPVEPADGIYFRVRNVGAAANWFAVSRKAGSETAVDTGILASTTFRILEFRIIGSTIVFLIDDVVVATITTNIPTVSLFWGVVVVTRQATNKRLTLDTLLLAGKR